ELKTVIGFDATGQGVMSFAELHSLGASGETPELISEYKRDADAVQPGDLATLIYTSGTTGPPKGVMLTHDNIHSNVAGTRDRIPFEGRDVSLSFLPLSHIFQRMGDYMMFATGTSIAYAENFDSVPGNLQEVRPTIVLSVPRLYEKMYARVLQNAVSSGALKKRIFFWARKVADRRADLLLAGRQPGRILERQY